MLLTLHFSKLQIILPEADVIVNSWACYSMWIEWKVGSFGKWGLYFHHCITGREERGTDAFHWCLRSEITECSLLTFQSGHSDGFGLESVYRLPRNTWTVALTRTGTLETSTFSVLMLQGRRGGLWFLWLELGAVPSASQVSRDVFILKNLKHESPLGDHKEKKKQK